MAATHGSEASGRWVLTEPPADAPVRNKTNPELQTARTPKVASATEYILLWLIIADLTRSGRFPHAERVEVI